jgi:hypothetical protein
MSRRNARDVRRNAGAGPLSQSVLFSRLQALAAGRPMFTMDNYTVDGGTGKVASFVDHNRPAHALVQATGANQVAVPAAHADFANALCGTFSGSEYYVSNDPASARVAAHNGVGEEWVLVCTPTTIGADHRPLATRTTGVSIGTTMALATGVPTMFVSNGAAIFLNFGGGGALSVNVPTYMTISYVEGRAPDEAVIYRKGTSVATASSASVPSAADSAFPLALGATAAGGQGFIGRIAAAFCLPPLTVSTRQLLQQWIYAKYRLVP